MEWLIRCCGETSCLCWIFDNKLICKFPTAIVHMIAAWANTIQVFKQDCLLSLMNFPRVIFPRLCISLYLCDEHRNLFLSGVITSNWLSRLGKQVVSLSVLSYWENNFASICYVEWPNSDWDSIHIPVTQSITIANQGLSTLSEDLFVITCARRRVISAANEVVGVDCRAETLRSNRPLFTSPFSLPLCIIIHFLHARLSVMSRWGVFWVEAQNNELCGVIRWASP